MIQIRKALETDVQRILEIYNEAILNTTATFDTEPKDLENRLSWFRNRDKNFPVIVAEINKEVVGFASLSKWSDKTAYDITAEISLYIHADHRSRGIGKMLIKQIVAMGQDTDLHTIIARITEGNEQSIHLHKMEGFEMVGVLKEVGRKFNRLLDVTIMQKVY
jgi:phosphinothricin acetyltransferase